MRLNRENSLIENNLYPLAGYHPPDIQKKFVEYLKPLEADILQVQAALLLHNLRLLGVLVAFFVGIESLAIWITPCIISYLTLAFITVPALTVVYTIGGVSFARKLYLSQLPALPATDPRRIRTLEEAVSYVWFPLLWGWRAAFFVYRLYVCPNAIDTVGFAVGAIVIGWIFKLLSFLALLLIATLCLFTGPALCTLTPGGKLIQQLIASVTSMVTARVKKE
jgi:hypothetical protein